MFVRRDTDAERIVIGSRLFNYSQYVPLDDTGIKELFIQRAPRVNVVVGDVAGIGKTKSCIQKANQTRKQIIRILNSDQCSCKQLAKLLGSCILVDLLAIKYSEFM